MNENRRIALNVVATYGRSLYALVAGLFTARWVLMTLGEVDFGLYSVVGGLAVFMTFLNELLATAVGRFYAYSVGEAKLPGHEASGLEECRRWFTTAVTLHTLVPLALMAVGYPVGEWAVRHFLTIAPDRVMACVWVWRCVCVTVLVGMLNVPFYAMYTAKQNIAELTIYSFVTTTLNVCMLFYMVTHPADWLVRYAAWMMLMAVVPQLIIGIRARLIYPECRFLRGAYFDWKYVKPILSFAGFRLLNGLSMVASNQGQGIVVNKCLGASANAAMGVGNQVTAQVQSLSLAFAGALYPAITNAAGEGRLDAMRALSVKASKYAVLSMLVFVVPLVLEIDPVLKLWLKSPPAFAGGLCSLVLAATVLERLTEGHWMAVFAVGRIARYQIAACIPSCFSFVLGMVLVLQGHGVLGVGFAILVSKVVTTAVRLHYGFREAGIAYGRWAKEVFVPALLVAAITAAVGKGVALGVDRLPRLHDFFRVVLVTGGCELVFLPLVWRVGLSAEERLAVIRRICHTRGYLFLHRVKQYLIIRRTMPRYRQTLQRLRAKAQAGQTIRVAFLVHVSSKWKCQSLYDWLEGQTQFEPFVVLDRMIGEALEVDFEKERAFFTSKGMRVEGPDGPDFDADIVFYQEPWGIPASHLPAQLAARMLTFYIPYYVPTHDTGMLACTEPDFHGMLYRQIVPSESWARYYRGFVNWTNYGGEMLGLGHTMLDVFRADGDVPNGYTIYAPHFAFPAEGMKVDVPISTFPETGRAMLAYAEAHPEMNWVFKPHPRLRDYLLRSGFMTADEVEAYFATWERIGTACYTGDYPRYFNAARAMITDCSSFLGEFAATGKPIIHLVTKTEAYPPAPVAERLFASFYRVSSKEELLETLAAVLERGQDPKREERVSAAKELGFFGHDAATRIGEMLKELVGIV